MNMCRSRWLALILLMTIPELLPAQAFSGAEQGVWERELKYWDLRTSGKIDEYLALWSDDFAGWPVRGNPGGKAEIRRLTEIDVANTRPGSFTFKLEPVLVRVYGDLAAVFYRARSSRVDKNGKQIDQYVRIMHTWKRTQMGWQIIAGMSADEPRK